MKKKKMFAEGVLISKKGKKRSLLTTVLSVILLLVYLFLGGGEDIVHVLPGQNVSSPQVTQDGVYTSKEEVALYIHLYGRLPDNFITKSEAERLGWTGGGLERYAPGKCIGGDRFGNYEGLLPRKSGRTYKECDIDTLGKNSRGDERIVFSNDGLIYYTDDHYQSFTLLYGEGT